MSKLFVTPILGLAAALSIGTIAISSETSAQDETSAVAGEPILLELFTSQGCSSCPPADRLAQKLSTDPDLVVISRPVTYWDRLGWKDTLARESNTELQRAYARKGLNGRNGVYTPQIVTDGRFGVVGSQENRLRPQISRSGTKQAAALRAKQVKGGAVAVGIAGPETAEAELVLVAVKRHAKVAIGRGENSGRTVSYTNVVRSEQVVGNWEGGEQGLLIDAALLQTKGADRYALILREENAGKVYAARWVN